MSEAPPVEYHMGRPVTAGLGDEPIQGSAVTDDDSTHVTIWEFDPSVDGAYAAEVRILGWNVGGDVTSASTTATWKRIDGVLSVSDQGTSEYAPFGLYVGYIGGGPAFQVGYDVSAGKGRIFVIGANATPMLYKLRGVRMSLVPPS